MLVVGAGIAYHEFVGKSATNEIAKAEGTFNEVQKMPEESAFLLEYLFNENPTPNEPFSPRSIEFLEKSDKALGFYFSIALCVQSGKCDPKIVARLVCPALLTDAIVINRTLGKEIARGGTFIDRSRIWSFYEQVEFCRNNGDVQKIDHPSFLARFQKEVDLLSKVDRSMSDKLRRNQ